MNKVKNFLTAFTILFFIILFLLLFANYDFRSGGLDYNSDSGEFTILGDTYALSEKFINGSKALFEFNKTFMGDLLFKAVKSVLVFAIDLCLEVLTTVFYAVSFAINGGTQIN